MTQSIPRQSITLNVPYDLVDEHWARVSAVYQNMPGWIGFDETPSWFGRDGDPRFVWASVEPSGLLIEGRLESDTWDEWIAALQLQLSSVLGFDVRDAET